MWPYTSLIIIYGPKLPWADLDMGRFCHGPILLWAELTHIKTESASEILGAEVEYRYKLFQKKKKTVSRGAIQS